MLTDIFYKRYSERLFWSDRPPPAVAKIFIQATHLIFDDIARRIPGRERFFQEIHDRLARELGVGILARNQTYEGMCAQFLAEPYDLWNNAHRDTDYFVKTRLSLIELVFRQVEQSLSEQRQRDEKGRRGFFASMLATDPVLPANGPTVEDIRGAVQELNARFREAQLPLHYHNGFIQIEHDDLSAQQIAEPFWVLVQDPKWSNVDLDMKEALHRRDSHGRDPALYAMKALESTIKIISDEKGWTSGNEKGAANYIDNLVSKKNGRFIDAWEAESLKAMFRDVRNPHGHGPGAGTQPVLSEHQTTWVIETCMAWVKSLVRRM